MTQANTVVAHLGADYFSEPYAVHARLRAQHPVAQVIMPGGTPAWLITGYAEARAALDRLREEARANERQPPFPIRGFDRDSDAVAAARANVRAAGLERAVSVAEADATRPLPLGDLHQGLLVTNPPYGDRLAQGGQTHERRQRDQRRVAEVGGQ